MNKKELDFVLQEGEGQYIEFKEKLDKKIVQEIVAFANASGGKIYLGIDDKNQIRGVNITNKLKSQIQDLANNCDPLIGIDFGKFGNVLVINVKEGKNKPHSCSSGFYMRVGPNSQKMRRDEIMDLAIMGGRIRFDGECLFDCVAIFFDDFFEGCEYF